MKMKKTLALLMSALLLASFASCGTKPAEDAVKDAAEDIENEVEEVVEDVAEDVADAAEDPEENVEEVVEDAAEDIAEGAEGAIGGFAGLANPMTELESADKLVEALGYGFAAPEGAENEQYISINELAETRFTKDGVQYTARMTPAEEFTDISGLYYTWTSEEDCTVAEREGKIRRCVGDESTVDSCLWFDVAPGMMYSLSAEAADLDGFDLLAVAEELFNPVQGEVYGDNEFTMEF